MKHLMAIPLLPADLIPTAFSNLLSQNIPMPTPADRLNFARFKRYVQRTWQRGVKPENLTVFESDHTTSNGCETFHAKLKAWIVQHRPNFWVFMLNFNKILEYHYKQYQQFMKEGKHSNVKFVTSSMILHYSTLYSI